jgi:hypothetical protein
MMVATEPKTDRKVGLDVAIERRNDKGKSRLFIVPANLAPENSAITPHPKDRRLTRELLRLHRFLLKAAVRVQGGTEDEWPATRVPISPEQFNLFDRLHEASDWVLTVDRNLGVEIFDNPRDSRGALQENARRYLIDYAPVQIRAAGQQLMISTSWSEEVNSLLCATLREMLIQ